MRYARKVKLAFIALFLTTLVVRYARKVILSIVLRETFLWDIIGEIILETEIGNAGVPAAAYDFRG